MGTTAQDAMIVSGRVLFDFAGRAVARYYPVTESPGRQGQFNTTFDSVAPTRTSYDVLDRTLAVTLPDNTRTTMSYGFGTDRDGQTRFETTVTDADGKAKVTYKDVRGLITSLKEFNAGKTLWTSYGYDAIKQIVAVKDARGNTTTAAYDLLGRRTRIDSPDAGRTDYVYDPASNLVQKVTANLRAKGQAINYDYTYNRLDAIRYPEYTQNNVAYTYGKPGAPFNRAGRIETVTDASGSEQRFYGPLGETIKTIKTVASATQGSSRNAPEIYTTEYSFDTYNRLRKLIYPDGETLTYHYNSGGLPDAVSGQKGSYAYPYVKALTYDKFEQRAVLQEGNGAVTTYSYDPATRRLATLKARTSQQVFMDMAYRYDAVGNILSLENKAAAPSDDAFGGHTRYEFAYDDLYRLTTSTGSFEQPDTAHNYTLSMAYDAIHNIVSKNQSDTRLSDEGDWIPARKTSYNFAYAYTSPHPHAPTHIGQRSFTYDADGNQTGWTSDTSGTRRIITWDEENRIRSIEDNGHLMTYTYNDAGQRVIKTGPHGETVYVNQFYSVSNREGGSKHIFVGTTRIATKLVKGQENVTTPANPGGITGTIDNPGNSDPNGNAWGHYDNWPNPPGNAYGLNQNTNNGGGSGGGAPGDGAIVYEPDVYYYHPDHLGSTAFVTDLYGRVYQHLEYFPFGETWIEEVSDRWRVPYLFTAKELDRETGLYYFGARYYDPRTSVWQSADPALGDYLDGHFNGGVFRSGNLGLYGYAGNNPLKYVDPDGQCIIVIALALVGAILHEWRDPSTVNAPNVGTKTVSSDSTATAIRKEATGASAVVSAIYSVDNLLEQRKSILRERNSQNNAPPETGASESENQRYHGNDRRNPNPQHNYVIKGKDGNFSINYGSKRNR
jgi:RHS repeat-associated protein